uniref:Uncharacterized protein n=1 Tax=Amphilophus citrinellus TaxID=61819 RepID=A0A3Q0T5Q4_AMPCI
MNILPRLLFLFQSLPINIPMDICTILNKWLSKFIWQNKRPRIRLKTLRCPKKLGGLNVPNLKKYYWAAHIRAMVTWICRDEDTIWYNMEQGDCQDIFLDIIPFVNQNTWSKNKISNQWVKFTLLTWTKIKNLPSSLCRVLPLKDSSCPCKEKVSWLKPQPPTVSLWKNRVREVYYMEQITAKLQMKSDTFIEK